MKVRVQSSIHSTNSHRPSAALDPCCFTLTLVCSFRSSELDLPNLEWPPKNLTTSNSRGPYHYQIRRCILRLPLSASIGPCAPTITQYTQRATATSPRRCVPTVVQYISLMAHDRLSAHHRFELKPTWKRRSPASRFQLKKLLVMTSLFSGSVRPARGETHPDSIRTDETPRLTERKMFPTLSSRRVGIVPTSPGDSPNV